MNLDQNLGQTVGMERRFGLNLDKKTGSTVGDGLKELNHLPPLSKKYLNNFHGDVEPYSFDDLCDLKFLTEHCCKFLLN